MFMGLGIKIDSLIEKIAEWHRGMFWYKIYGYFFIMKKIKNKVFIDYEHFETFMGNIERFEQAWKWQLKLYWKMYHRKYGK